MIFYLLALIGVLKIILPIYNIILTIFYHLKPLKSLTQRYGEKTWAVITGGTDGIGFGFCEELAEQGFNICIISRNKDKI